MILKTIFQIVNNCNVLIYIDLHKIHFSYLHIKENLL